LKAALERDAVIGAIRFDAIQALQKIEVPHGAAIFAVGRALQSDPGLFSDRLRDRSVLGGTQFVCRDFAALTACSSFLQGYGT
jgi:hypothetical protein